MAEGFLVLVQDLGGHQGRLPMGHVVFDQSQLHDVLGHGVGQSIHVGSLEVAAERPTKGESDGVENSHFHLTDLGFGISAVCSVHEIADFIVFLANVVDKDIGESSGFYALLHFEIFAGNEMSNEDFFAVQQHSIDLVDGTQGCSFGFEMDKAIAFALAVGHVEGNLAVLIGIVGVGVKFPHTNFNEVAGMVFVKLL